MKIIRSVLALLVIAFIFTGCSSDSRTKLVIYSPHGKEMLSEFERQFEEANKDIDIQWQDLGSQVIFDRVRTEKDNPQADIWWGAPATIYMKADKMGLLEPYTPAWAGSISPDHKSKNNTWYGTFLTPEVIAFNKSVLNKQTAPQDWDALTTAEWKGKVVLRNPMESGTLRVIFSSMIDRAIKNGGGEQAGFEWLKMLDGNTVSYTSDPTQMYLKLAGNESPVTLWNMPDIILQSAQYGYPFDYVFPANGTVVLTDGIAILKGAKNIEAAKKFYEFVTSEKALILQSEKFYRIPARTDIPRDKLPKWVQEANYKEMKVDWDLLSEKETEWMKKWDAEIKSSSGK